jgi:hypothetical protein
MSGRAYAQADWERGARRDDGADRAAEQSKSAKMPSAAAALALAPESRVAEDRGALEPDEEQRRAANGGGGGGKSSSAPAPPPKSTASLALTGNAYADTATESKKDITFNATWSGGAKEDFIIVNWLKGYEKNGKGKAYKVKMYRSKVDFNFADWRVDSVDEDPAYWSNGGRWNYDVDGPNAFSATDSPGPMNTSDGAGAEAKVSFKTAVYRSADVPTKTTGTIPATPLSSFQYWDYTVTVQGGGKFKH